MKATFSVVHGIPRKDLRDYLVDAVESFNNNLVIDDFLIGGWSNINLLARQDDMEYIVKLPSLITRYDCNPYEHEFSACRCLSLIGVAPVPVEIGRLTDPKASPFFVLEYASGHLVDDLSDFKVSHYERLDAVRNELASADCQAVPTFQTQDHYLDYLLATRLKPFYPSGPAGDLSQELTEAIEVLLGLIENYNQSKSDGVPWSTRMMHGDLQESNILFTNSSAILLDMEMVCYGEPLYDAAYLVVQNPNINEPLIPDAFISEETLREEVLRLFPLALIAVLSWSINRLAKMELGIIEPTLAKSGVRQAMLEYMRNKTMLFEKVLSED